VNINPSIPVLTLALAVTAFLPGLTWLAWERRAGRDPLEYLADALGISLALIALTGLVFYNWGLRLSPFDLVILLVGVGLAWLGAFLWRPRKVRWSRGWFFALAFLLALIAWRLFQARSLVLPPWVDSVHHSLIVRKMMEFGGLMPDLQPYLPLPFYYHYGFHLATSIFAVLSNLEAPQAVLIFGQVMNAAIALSIYRLGKAIWHDWRRAGLAAILVAFVFQMPAYYLTWGRFTLATGLVILLVAMATVLELRDSPVRAYPRLEWRARQPFRERWRALIHWQRGLPLDWAVLLRLGVLVGGLCLTHYLATGIFGLFLIAYLLVGLKPRRWEGRPRRVMLHYLLPLAATALGVLLAWPWLFNMLTFQVNSFKVDVSLPASLEGFKSLESTANYLLYLIGPEFGHFLMILAVLGAAYVLWRGSGRWLALWGLMLFPLALPFGLRLGPFRPDHVAIVLFLPAALLVANLLVEASGALGRVTLPRAGPVVLGVVTALLLLLGLVKTVDILNPATILVDQADMAALRWITENTPPTARFYINSTPWMGKSYRGVDGGYWIMPQTGRWSSIPTSFYTGADAGYTNYIVGLAERSAQVEGCSVEFWKLIRDGAYTHLYIRQGIGAIQPYELWNCPRLQLAYYQDGVFIYEIKR
jgi:hypothetical protein